MATERQKQESKMGLRMDKLFILLSKLFNRKRLRELKCRRVSDPLNFPVEKITETEN